MQIVILLVGVIVNSVGVIVGVIGPRGANRKLCAIENGAQCELNRMSC